MTALGEIATFVPLTAQLRTCARCAAPLKVSGLQISSPCCVIERHPSAARSLISGNWLSW
jgi:hypothetical protein